MIRNLLVLLFTAATLSLTASGQAKNTWTKYTSPKADFNITVPCQFEVTSETIKAPGGDIDQTYHQCFADPRLYIVSSAEFGAAPAAADRPAVLDGFRNGVIESMKSTLVNEKQITLGAAPGREFVTTQTKGEVELIFKWRIYIVGKRLYGTGVATSKASAATPEVDKFLTSFTPR